MIVSTNSGGRIDQMTFMCFFVLDTSSDMFPDRIS